MCLTMAMFSGPWPVRKRARSSWKTTSMTQCRRFSTPQWARTAWAKVGASRRADEKSRREIISAREGRLAAPLHLGLDHGDGGKARKARLAREAAIGREPGHVMADNVAPDLDAAMVAVGRGVPVEIIVRGGGKEALDLAVQVRPIVFHRDQVV